MHERVTIFIPNLAMREKRWEELLEDLLNAFSKNLENMCQNFTLTNVSPVLHFI